MELKDKASKNLVSPKDAAEFLGLKTEKTLAVWRNTKRYPLPYIKIGGKVKYRLVDLESFIESRMVRP